MNGKGLLPMPAEGPQFVESCHVIQMRMGIKNGTNSVEALTKGLLAKIRAAVDEDRGSGGLQVEGRPCTPIAGMIRTANGAGAANDRDAHRGAGAKKSSSGVQVVHGRGRGRKIGMKGIIRRR